MSMSRPSPPPPFSTPADACSSPPARRMSRSMPCATSGTDHPVAWASRLAEEAGRDGWNVTLLLGPTPFSHSLVSTLLPHTLQTHRFRTTADLERLLMEHWPRADVLIMAAAVADYRPKPLVGRARCRNGEDQPRRGRGNAHTGTRADARSDRRVRPVAAAEPDHRRPCA